MHTRSSDLGAFVCAAHLKVCRANASFSLLSRTTRASGGSAAGSTVSAASTLPRALLFNTTGNFATAVFLLWRLCFFCCFVQHGSSHARRRRAAGSDRLRRLGCCHAAFFGSRRDPSSQRAAIPFCHCFCSACKPSVGNGATAPHAQLARWMASWQPHHAPCDGRGLIGACFASCGCSQRAAPPAH